LAVLWLWLVGLGGKAGLPGEVVDCRVVGAGGGAEPGGHGRAGRGQLGQASDEHPLGEPGQEHRLADASGGDLVAEGAGELSWAVINTVYTLRYADQHFRSRPGGIAFGAEDGQQHPGYRDFAHVAFTIGMCYQVSGTTLRAPRIRRMVLAYAILSYVYGVVIVAGSCCRHRGLNAVWLRGER
jgi:Protein of unknown function (DUF1345)